MQLKYFTASLSFFAALLAVIPHLYAQPPRKGVAYALALQRHAQIKQVAYQLSFAITGDTSNAIQAKETISFTLQQTANGVQLDFRQPRNHVQSVLANGHRIPIRLLQEHLLIDSRWLIAGRNVVSIRFIAGNESLNRNSAYVYALFVPDRARTVFPCFDQPDIKAVFRLSLTIPASWNALANAAVADSAVSTEKENISIQANRPPSHLSFLLHRRQICHCR